MSVLDTGSFINENRVCTRSAIYLAPNGKDVYSEWRSGIRDNRARIARELKLTGESTGWRLDNFGDHRFCRDGVWELRVDVGPGYRVYYAIAGATIAGAKIVLLILGGDKSSQNPDIDRACAYWLDWQRRVERSEVEK